MGPAGAAPGPGAADGRTVHPAPRGAEILVGPPRLPNAVATVVVLGTHRSGTSLVAGMLHALGVRMGPPGNDDAWIYPNWANPTGQYENPELTDLLHRLLDFDGEEPRWDPRWADLGAPLAAFRPDLERFVDRTRGPLWGFKHPWALLILGGILGDLPDPRFVVVRRRLDEVVDSLHRRDGLSAAEATRVSEELLGRLERLLAEHPDVPTLRLEYAEVVADPARTAGRIVEFLALHPGAEAIARAEALVVRGPPLRRAIRHRAAHDLATLPARYGWLLSKDLRERSRFTATHLYRSLPRELYRILRAMA